MHILDADTLLALPERARDGHLNDLIDDVCELIQRGEATFPTVVRNEAISLAGANHSSWLKAVSGCCKHTSLPYDRVVEVMAGCPQAMDINAADEPSQVYVIATALQVAALYENVVVVTDEILELPDRMPLAAVCDMMDVKHCSASEFFIEFDLAHHVRL